MAYSRQNPLVITPDGDDIETGVEKLDEEFDSFIDYVNNFGTQSLAGTKRQSVLYSSVDGSGNPNYLTASGLNVSLDGSTKPVILAFANGFDTAKGTIDVIHAISSLVSNAWTLPSSQTCYLYIDKSITNGIITYGYSLFPDLYQSYAPASPSLDQHCYDTVDCKMYRYNGSSWEEKLRIFVGKAVTSSSSMTLSIYDNESRPFVTSLSQKNKKTKNKIINGDMRVSEYIGNNSLTITAGAAKTYAIDGHYCYCSGSNITAQRVSSGVNGQKFKMRYTGAASNTSILHGHRIESLNCGDLVGKVCTLQAQIANSLLTTVSWVAYYANTDDTFGTIASPTRTQFASGAFAVTSTETIYSTQIDVPAAATTGIEIVFSVANQTSGTFDITGIQLESGYVATPFEVIDISDVYNQCQRRYYPHYWSLQSPAAASLTVTATFPVVMRTIPTAANLGTGTVSNLSTVSIAALNNKTFQMSINASAANGYVSARTDAFSAEL